MKTNQEILEYIVSNPDYKEAVRNITKGDEFTEDLWAELLIIIGEYDNAKLNKLFNEGTLKFFFVRIALNQYRSANSPFYKKYKKEDVEKRGEVELEFEDYMVWNEVESVTYEPDEEQPYDKDSIMYEETWAERVARITERSLDSLHWYQAELFRLYVKYGTYKKVSENTGIPIRSVGTTIRSVKDYLKVQIDKDLRRNG